MTGQSTIHYQISSQVDLDQLLRDVPTIEGSVVIVAFDEVPRFRVTSFQLARIVAAARTHNLRLVVESSNRDIVRDALLVGFHESALHSDVASDPFTKSIPPVVSGVSQPAAEAVEFTTTSNLATYRPVEGGNAPTFRWKGSGKEPLRRTTQTGTLHVVDANWSSGRFQSLGNVTQNPESEEPGEAPTAVISPTGPPVSTFGRSGAVESSDHETQEDEEKAPPAPSPKRKKRRRFVLAAAIAAPVAVLVTVGVLAAYMVPTATVTIVPVEDPVESTLTYGVSTGEQTYDITIDPESYSDSFSVEASRETSGERHEPDGTAWGSVQITNPLTSDVTIPAGTELSGANGVSYYTSEDLVIPAADPFGSRSFGSATVGAYAGIAGPDGNLEPGGVTGQLGNGLFYTNLDAMSGGTLRAIAVATEDDLEHVRSKVETELLDRAEQEFLQGVPSRLEVVPDSVEVGEPEIDVYGTAGEDSDEVSASGTITVRAEVYDPDELHQQARSEADRLLARDSGGDRILLAETVDVQEPVALNSEETAFKIDVAAVARQRITDEEIETIIRDIAGKDVSDAEALLEAHMKIEAYDIEIEPDWLLNRLPEVTSRIEVIESRGEGTRANR